MIKYVSTLGGIKPVDFDQAILDGKPSDGGLFVPTHLPTITVHQLTKWKTFSYPALVFELLSLFISEQIIPSADLRQIIDQSFATFHEKEIILHKKLPTHPRIIIQELFHGPTLSFKDVAMGFVVNLFEYFLEKHKKKTTVMVATSGDTGPAAAFASLGKTWVDTWVLYPKGQITTEQERQMTTLTAANVHVIGVQNCPDGSDDLDSIIALLFADEDFQRRFNLSSVNSINWGRILLQTAHYFYGYLQNIDEVGEPLNFSVPTGAFGNLCAGFLARKMGLPVKQFVLANNLNTCLADAFIDGVFHKKDVIPTPSSAIDISVPLNFWRFLYFQSGGSPHQVRKWMREFDIEGRVNFDSHTHQTFKEGFRPHVVSDKDTYATIKYFHQKEDYLLDPHGAVAVAAARHFDDQQSGKIVCLATAHPAKFPQVIRQALGNSCPGIFHASIERTKSMRENGLHCSFEEMYDDIPRMMENHRNKNNHFWIL